jgi:hypothetical protein
MSRPEFPIGTGQVPTAQALPAYYRQLEPNQIIPAISGLPQRAFS